MFVHVALEWHVLVSVELQERISTQLPPTFWTKPRSQTHFVVLPSSWQRSCKPQCIFPHFAISM